MQFILLAIASLLPTALSLVAPQTYQVLQLPDNFDYSHPALDYAAHARLLAADPNAKLPELPAEVLALAKTVAVADGPTSQADVWICETSSGSPRKGDVHSIANNLQNNAPQYCCQTSNGDCTVMWYGG